MSYRYNAYSQNGYVLENGYNQQNAGDVLVLPFNNHPTLTNGLVAYWNMNETTGNRLDQINPVDQNLFVRTGSDPGSVTGKMNNALNNNGTVGKWGVLDDNALNFSNTTGGTWSFWIKSFSPTGDGGTFLSKIDVDWTSEAYDFQLGLDTGSPLRHSISSEVYDADWNGDQITVSHNLSGQWHHVLVWWDPADRKHRMRIDGGITSVSFVAVSGAPYAGGVLTFGDTSAGDNTSKSYLDEVGFWNRVLSVDEQDDLFNAGLGLPYDSSVAPSVLGEGLLFGSSFEQADAANEYCYPVGGVVLGMNGGNTVHATGRSGSGSSLWAGSPGLNRACLGSNITLVPTADFTFSAWIKLIDTTGSGGNRWVWVYQTYDSTKKILKLTTDPGTGALTAKISYSSGNDDTITGAAGDLVVGSWVHVAVRRSGTALKMFIDDTRATYTATATGVTDFSSFFTGNSGNGTLYMGGYTVLGQDYCKFYIDDMYLWKRALTDGEISTMAGGQEWPFS